MGRVPHSRSRIDLQDLVVTHADADRVATVEAPGGNHDLLPGK